MSVARNKEIVRRYLEEVVDTGDLSRIEEFISPDYVETDDKRKLSRGIEGARQHILGVRQVYGDLKLTIEQQIAEGEWVVTRVRGRGVHQGEWMGMAPTGKPIEIIAYNVDRLVDGKIVEHGGGADMLAPLLKIGAVRVVGPGGSDDR